MFPFNIVPIEREPTKDELIEGFIHYISSTLLLHGVGKNFCKWVSELKSETLCIEDIYKIMNHNSHQIDRVKDILFNLPTIKISTDNSDD